jgi:hypothetical protein
MSGSSHFHSPTYGQHLFSLPPPPHPTEPCQSQVHCQQAAALRPSSWTGPPSSLSRGAGGVSRSTCVPRLARQSLGLAWYRYSPVSAARGRHTGNTCRWQRSTNTHQAMPRTRLQRSGLSGPCEQGYVCTRSLDRHTGNECRWQCSNSALQAKPRLTKLARALSWHTRV